MQPGSYADQANTKQFFQHIKQWCVLCIDLDIVTSALTELLLLFSGEAQSCNIITHIRDLRSYSL